jgi:hypothetical protein
MPFSYQGFGFTTILLMVALLSASQLVRYLKGRRDQRASQRMIKRPGN